MDNQSILPTEVICRVLCFLSPYDVIKLRVISRQFRDISYLPEIWRTFYANAPLPRPPGPFPCQSVQFLERTLIKSERLAKTWTAQPMRILSTVRVRLEGFASSSASNIIQGRWLIGCESSRKFVVHDLDSDTIPPFSHVLWEHEQPLYENWDVCTVTSLDGPLVYIVFNEDSQRLAKQRSLRSPINFANVTVQDTLLPWKLLEFRLSSASGQWYHSTSLDLPTKEFLLAESLSGNSGPFLYLSGHGLIFDAETRQLYTIPELDPALRVFSPVRQFKRPIVPYMLFTKTHVIALHSLTFNTSAPRTLIQAWTPSQAPEVHSTQDQPFRSLVVSHEATIASSYLPVVCVIRNSIVDPISGSTNIRFLYQTCHPEATVRFSCLDITLPKHSDTNIVSEMSIRTYDIFEAENVPYVSSPEMACHIGSSDDGYARGILQLRWMDAILLDYQFLQFVIDASGEICTGAIGEVLYPAWGPMDRHLSLDSTRGRLCYLNRFPLAQDKEAAKCAFLVDME